MTTEIVSYNYGLEDEMIKNPKVNLVGIDEMSITYMQEPDTNSESDEYQYLTVTSRQACAISKEDAEKEEGFYFDITIPEGQHWSVENGDDIKAVIDDFKKRIYMTNKKQ